jgi:inositol phosphorylceramide synthase regulatory subunit
MGLTSRLLRLPRPRTFLYTMSLTTGASLITLSLLLNKVSGLYGLLALLTGFELNSLQLSMYIYSLLALALTAYLAPHIRTQSPLHCLALAWFYTVDSIINAAYTAAFGVTWFLVLAQHNAGKNPGDRGPGAGTIDETSGFTKPEHNVSGVDVVPVTPGSSAEDASALIGAPASSPAGTDASGNGSGKLAHSVLQPESMNSLGVIVALWTIRLYFCVVMLSYARMVLRQHVMLASMKNNTYTTASTDSGFAENPFARSKPEGQGWKGRLGRLMIAFPRQYWLGSGDGEERGQDVSWMEGMGGKFRQGGLEAAAGGGSSGGGGGSSSTASGNANVVESGPLERERRRRSGTGPPPPHVQLSTLGQKGLSVPSQDL